MSAKLTSVKGTGVKSAGYELKAVKLTSEITADLQANLQRDGNGRTDIHILYVRRETTRRDNHDLPVSELGQWNQRSV